MANFKVQDLIGTKVLLKIANNGEVLAEVIDVVHAESAEDPEEALNQSDFVVRFAPSPTQTWTDIVSGTMFTPQSPAFQAASFEYHQRSRPGNKATSSRP
jgi:hypothetical protein